MLGTHHFVEKRAEKTFWKNMLPIAEEMLDDSDKGERKRQREKQRRSDLASAFEELQMALSRIEHGCDAYGRPIKMDRNAETPVTRLGLILQTTETLQRLHHENVHMRYALGGPYIDDHMVSIRLAFACSLASP